MTTRTIDALLAIMADSEVPTAFRVQSAAHLLGFEAPADSVSRAREYLAQVFDDTEQHIKDRMDALQISRKFEAKKIAPQTVHVTRQQETDRKEAWRNYEMWIRKRDLIAATRQIPPRDYADDLLQPRLFASTRIGVASDNHRALGARHLPNTPRRRAALKRIKQTGRSIKCLIRNETDKTPMRGVSIVGDNDDTHYPYLGRRHYDRAVTSLWLVSLHDGRRGPRQVSQGASCLDRHQSLLDIRDSACAFATLTCGRTRAFHATRTHGGAGAFLPTRNQ